MNTETEFKLPPVDALRANDQALLDMQATTKSPEDIEAFNQLINEQVEGYKAATVVEVRDASTGAENIHVAHNIGNAALHNPMAIHSEGWKTEQK